MAEIIKQELNVKTIKFLSEDSGILKKQIKPNFKTLGPKFGKDMGLIASKISHFSLSDIKQLEEKYSIINDKIKIK